jgi:hypothetical protein
VVDSMAPRAEDVKPGTLYWVRFGGFGSQLALVKRVPIFSDPRVYKWREKSRTWVGPVRISPSAFLFDKPVDLSDPLVTRARAALGPQLSIYAEGVEVRS